MIVFVYGTLMKGYGNNKLLADSKFISKASIQEGFTMYDCGWFPGVKQDGGKKPIHGELYECNDNVLLSLDYLEGYPTFYDRVQVDYKKAKCWIYVYQPDRKPSQAIPHGNWRRYEQQNRRHR